MKKKNWIILGAFIIVILVAGSLLQGTTLVGQATATTGCCTLICQETSATECPTEFVPGETCSDLDQCNVGCCVDTSGYCYSNYLKNNCEVSGSLFVSGRECNQNPVCLTAPAPLALRGYTGFPFIYPTFTEGIVTTDHFARQLGQPFTIKTVLFDDGAGTYNDVRVKIENEEYSKTLLLYDDGDHGDGEEEDGVFANIWLTHDFPSFNGHKVLTLNATINNQANIPQERIYLSAESCLPMSRRWQEGREDIIFIESYTDQTTFRSRTSANKVLGTLAQRFIPDEFNGKNFYEVLPFLNTQNASKAQRIVQQKCEFYDNVNDTIIFMDDLVDYCEQEEKMIHISPSIFLNKTAIDKNDVTSLDVVLDDFCGYTLSDTQLQEQAHLALIPPNITVILPTNGTFYDDNEIQFEFIINDTHESVYYEVYRDINRPEMMMRNGTALQNQNVNFTLNISDGEHFIWIEATDEDDNLVASELVYISVDEADFIVHMESLEPLTYNESPWVNFSVSHHTTLEVDYRILLNTSPTITINASGLLNGTVDVGDIVRFMTNLSNGTHVIQVVATDDIGRKALSLPYIFYIGQSPEEVFG